MYRNIIPSEVPLKSRLVLDHIIFDLMITFFHNVSSYFYRTITRTRAYRNNLYLETSTTSTWHAHNYGSSVLAH